MMIIMKANATPQEVEAVIAQIKSMGLAVHFEIVLLVKPGNRIDVRAAIVGVLLLGEV